MSNNTAAFLQLASYVVAISTNYWYTHSQGGKISLVIVINLEKGKILCYKQKIATLFKVHSKYFKILSVFLVPPTHTQCL